VIAVVATVNTNLEDALKALEREEREIQRRLVEVQSGRATLERLIGVRPSAKPAVSLEYQGLGSVEAASRLLKQEGKAMSTRELVDGMLERGWTTRSRNPTAALFAGLANAKKKFKRTSDDKWELVG
jgi:hypothetical protein